MHKNREFTISDISAYAESLGYALLFQRYKRVFTLRSLSSPDDWGWMYFPQEPEKLIELVDDLSLDEWKIAVKNTIKSINGG
ncbi:hypothetical protein ACSI5N_25215 (plasmid) [Raoultella ornithinolytica]|uniref:hypothetical protein n=1 Tax=Raoultella ornithinolytica TaxID=54291 RepID=UPI00292C3CB5|nr:hypothetical protein [Raoultella ornithinolytica]MDV1094925.1 hypothetical protein [Raoultella ornithinolytica]MDV1122731.1 hypothetical protein [Raoultella ornithinolytica]MDV1893246.1 hypothetical protein [Raoultella ornithinolytica]